MTAPVFSFFPYLSMREPVEFGPWWLGPAERFQGYWHSPRFRELSLQLLGAHRDPFRRQIEAQAILAHGSRGVGGEPPPEDEYLAVQRAVHFAVLDSNPPWSTDRDGWQVRTTDNSDLFMWPIDLNDGSVALQSGSMVCRMTAGYEITPTLEIPAPKELVVQFSRNLDGELLDVLYRVLANPDLGDRDLARRIGVAIDWLAHAWRNSPSITMEHRVVMLKIAFEALTGSDKTHKSAIRLERAFRNLDQAGIGEDQADHLLWSPKESKRFTRTWGSGNHEACTDLVHWFHALGSARNNIIHEGAAKALEYQEEGSAYNGPLVNIAERLLRETIRVCLRDFGFDNLWEPAVRRSIRRKLGMQFPATEEGSSGHATEQ